MRLPLAWRVRNAWHRWRERRNPPAVYWTCAGCHATYGTVAELPNPTAAATAHAPHCSREFCPPLVTVTEF